MLTISNLGQWFGLSAIIFGVITSLYFAGGGSNSSDESRAFNSFNMFLSQAIAAFLLVWVFGL